MRKIMFRTMLAAIVVFAVDMVILGLKISDGDYDVIPCACIGLVCLSAIVICGVCKAFEKCPHCGRAHLTAGEYCPYCGEKLTK